MTTEESALLAAILAQPADDTPRLVYADWLQENGETNRAEFIRRSVADGRLVVLSGDRRWVLETVGGDTTKLLSQSDWSAVLDLVAPFHSIRLSGGSIGIRRGFVAEIRCTATSWLRHAGTMYWRPSRALRRANPARIQPVERVMLTTMPEYDEFGSQPTGHGNIYLYALGRLAPADDDPRVVWCERHVGERDIVGELLRRRWPGITFELPQAAT